MDASPKVRDVAELVDVSSQLSEHERTTQARVRRLMDDLVRPEIAHWYEDGRFPRELVRELGAAGLLGMSLTGYGCAGASPTSYGLACLELEAADSGLRSFVSVQGSLAMYSIAAFGSDEQKDEWLPRLCSGEAIGCFALTEPEGGSDPGSLRVRAERDGSDWVLTGHKRWATSATMADVATIWARTDEGIRGFLVPTDTDGFQATPITEKLSMRVSASSAISLDGVRLPADAALPGATGLSAALRCLNEARFSVVYGALGAARDCLQVTRDYALSREQFGRPIAGFQLTQRKLADMAVGLSTGLLLALHLGRRKEARHLEPEELSTGKLHNVRVAIDIARTCRTILAASGITSEFPVMRHANNLESVLTYEGTEEIHALVVGQALTGISAFR